MGRLNQDHWTAIGLIWLALVIFGTGLYVWHVAETIDPRSLRPPTQCSTHFDPWHRWADAEGSER